MKAIPGSRTWLKRQRKKEARKRRHQGAAPEPIVSTRAFYQSAEWKRVRYMALQRSHGRCDCCGASPQTGAVLRVDHIKPLRKFPELALNLDNLQVLCGSCNQGKGSWDQTDWRRPIDEILDLQALSDLRDRGLLN